MTYSTDRYELHDVRRIVIAGNRLQIAVYRQSYSQDRLVIWKGNHRNPTVAFFQGEGETRKEFIERVRVEDDFLRID